MLHVDYIDNFETKPLDTLPDLGWAILSGNDGAHLRWPRMYAVEGLAAELDALLPAVLDKAFKGEL